MTPLTPKTTILAARLFPANKQAIQRILEEECGQNLPFCQDSTPESLERLRFAALKVGSGDVDRFLEAISLARRDWRDLLMWAEFANDLQAHQKWADQILGGKP